MFKAQHAAFGLVFLTLAACDGVKKFEKPATYPVLDVPLKNTSSDLASSRAEQSLEQRESVMRKMAHKRYKTLEEFERANLNGSWTWFAYGPDGKTTQQGLLTFVDLEDGQLSGHSYVPILMQLSKGGAANKLQSFDFSGSKEWDKDGAIKI